MIVDKDRFRLLIDSAINEKQSFKSISLILSDYKNQGGRQENALEILESMRKNATESYEDKILEIMDIASGFCSIEHKVW